MDRRRRCALAGVTIEGGGCTRLSVVSGKRGTLTGGSGASFIAEGCQDYTVP